MAAAVLAHAAHGNALGTPEVVLEVGLVVVAGLTWLALRTSWPRPRLAAAADGRLLPAWTAPALRGLAAVGAAAGLVVWAVTLTAGLFATDDPGENLAPFVISTPVIAGGLLVSVLLGDWWRAVSPFATLARILPDRTDPPPAPAWAGPALLASLLWSKEAFHDGGEVRWVGLWLFAYTAAVLAGAAIWGRAWAATGEGIAVLLGAAGRMSPLARDAGTGRLRLRAPLAGLGRDDLPPGTAATLLLAGGAAVYGAVHRLDWFQLEVMGLRSGWERTVVDTFGLAFAVGLAAVVWWAVAGDRAGDPGPLVPLATGVVAAFLLTDLATRTIDVLALLSDPYDRGWDLFGSADWFAPTAWQTSARLAWAELLAIAAGTALAVVVAHDRAPGERSSGRVAAAVTVLGTASLVVLLR